MFDIVLIGGMLFTNYPKYVAKKELGRWIPSISLNLKHGGNALIDRADRMQSVRAITAMAKTAQERNVSVVIFPEGTRSRDGRLGEFKRAGTEALLRAADQLPVVPAAVDGSWRLSNMLPMRFGSKVRIRFGAPIERRPGDANAVMMAARGFIEDALADWSASPAG
jgi:1-acyl-sn-glycerol-3-phosphate acyltransferase